MKTGYLTKTPVPIWMRSIMTEGWIETLRDAATTMGSIKAAADAIGYSRTTVSLVLSGNYDRSTAEIAQAVMAKLQKVACPYLDHMIERETCLRTWKRTMPQSNPEALRHWSHCQTCAVKTATLRNGVNHGN